LFRDFRYRQLFDTVSTLGAPDNNAIRSILAIATHGDDTTASKICSPAKTAAAATSRPRQRAVIKNIEPVLYLFKWLRETEYEEPEQQVWLTENLLSLCSGNIQNRMLCCQSGVILELIKVLQLWRRLNPKSAVALLRLVELLGKKA
jgi:hypothetical protein